MTNLRQIIRESIQEYIREIDEAGDIAALEAKITKTQEAIDKRKKLSSKDGLDEEYHAFLDERKMKEMTSEIKHLEKSLGKYNKTLEKLKSKASWNDQERGFTWNSQQIDVDGELEEMTTDPAEETSAQLEDKEAMNEEQVLYMQKIAGIISETEYKTKVEEAKKKASAGLTKKQKSAISKKAHAGKDIGKKGKGFEKVAKAGEKQYGSKEAGEKVAAAAMWKNAAKKAKSLKEEVQALFEDESEVNELFGFGKSKGNPNNLKVGDEVTYTASNGNDGYNGKYVVGKILSSDPKGFTIGIYKDTSEPHTSMKPEQKQVSIYAKPEELKLR